MSLVTMNEVFPIAEEKKIAIPAFNVDTLEIAQAVLETIEEENAPSIIAVGQAAIKDGKLEALASIVTLLAGKMKTPVVLHLDHGQNFEQVIKALRAGYSSVMIDGSTLSLADNIAVTKQTVQAAHAVGASVEAELGAILGSEDNISHDDSKPFLVKVQDVVDFTSAVDVDALAVGIGNAHGLYKGRPNLDFDRLREVAEVCPAPLVLHGGSGIPADMIKTAIEIGIRKINVATEVRLSYVKGLNAESRSEDYYTMTNNGKRCVKELVREKIRLFSRR
ncbi:class II fructose-bisphosphate aldolase [[Clostridium] symbiosum]|uniref:class II fructose-bisphosphate aldolase n=1 Tax=Clostridium symbiosum TaxID=1512 RepID=UPI001D08087E|nr:class II fructose-bisphosphate aldolase [[Clostridium] symbiosum]MCB6609248.1 class II fructose-bisphosphate aldolase [[Clostridium] symbiosum]MCB6932788.1 class II fructose-bisphosphate aldolase [[Clostridium] symbiosum]